MERVDEEEEEAAESPEPLKPVIRKVSPNTILRLSPHNSDDSLDSKEAYPYSRNDTPDLHPEPHSRERTPDSDAHLGAREKSPESQGTREKSPESDDGLKMHDEDSEHAARPKLARERLAEDEGVSEISDAPRPIISTHTYHPKIGRNKKFLKLVATAPCPQRRPGTTLLATLGRVQAMYGKTPGEEAGLGSAEDASSRARFQRRSEGGPSGSQKVTLEIHFFDYILLHV